MFSRITASRASPLLAGLLSAGWLTAGWLTNSLSKPLGDNPQPDSTADQVQRNRQLAVTDQ